MDYYLNITDPKNEPDWFDWYLSIRDDEGFTLPNPNGGIFFCNDQEILDDPFSSATLRNCQESWLYEAINPYTSQYESISYPGDLFPYNDTSCDAFPTCQIEWLNISSNPFSDDTSEANAFDNDNFFCGTDYDDAQRTCDRPCPLEFVSYFMFVVCTLTTPICLIVCTFLGGMRNGRDMLSDKFEYVPRLEATPTATN